MIRYCLPLVALTLLVLASNESFAQRVPNFNRRPTISPYVNLFNNNQGGVNNYFSFVRPIQRQQQFNQQQLRENRFLQRQLSQPPQAQIPSGQLQSGMLRAGSQGIGQPSQAAGYFNYSHFYSVPAVSRRR